MSKTTRKELPQTPENALKALRAQMGEKAFYAALHRLKYRTIADVPVKLLPSVLERLESE